MRILWAKAGTGTQWAILKLDGFNSVLWVKPTRSYTSGNTFTFNPCGQDGSNLDSSTTLTLYLSMPMNNNPQGITLDSSQVYPYAPFFDITNNRNSGLVLGLNANGLPDNTGKSRYMVLQMNADNTNSTNNPRPLDD